MKKFTITPWTVAGMLGILHLATPSLPAAVGKGEPLQFLVSISGPEQDYGDMAGFVRDELQKLAPTPDHFRTLMFLHNDLQRARSLLGNGASPSSPENQAAARRILSHARDLRDRYAQLPVPKNWRPGQLPISAEHLQNDIRVIASQVALGNGGFFIGLSAGSSPELIEDVQAFVRTLKIQPAQQSLTPEQIAKLEQFLTELSQDSEAEAEPEQESQSEIDNGKHEATDPYSETGYETSAGQNGDAHEAWIAEDGQVIVPLIPPAEGMPVEEMAYSVYLQVYTDRHLRHGVPASRTSSDFLKQQLLAILVKYYGIADSLAGDAVPLENALRKDLTAVVLALGANEELPVNYPYSGASPLAMDSVAERAILNLLSEITPQLWLSLVEEPAPDMFGPSNTLKAIARGEIPEGIRHSDGVAAKRLVQTIEGAPTVAEKRLLLRELISIVLAARREDPALVASLCNSLLTMVNAQSPAHTRN